MTTAHRATHRSAISGKTNGPGIYIVPTRQFAARDCPSHLKMKDRKTYQKGFKGLINQAEKRRQKNDLFRKIVKGTALDGKYNILIVLDIQLILIFELEMIILEMNFLNNSVYGLPMDYSYCI